LAARELLVSGEGGWHMQVRGDLGIAVAFQQRARVVLDARVTGTAPGEPWRTLLLPQPERICLVARIDALGVHKLSLHPTDDALDDLTRWLPHGDPDTTHDLSPLDSAERTALVTVTRYTAQGSAEVAGESTDLVLAERRGRLYAFGRDEAGESTLTSRSWDGRDSRETLTEMLQLSDG
jgi:hypothetical protein